MDHQLIKKDLGEKPHDISVNMHPVKIIQFVSKNSQMKNHLSSIVKVLTLMSEKEMKRGKTTNEILAFKFHYISHMLNLLLKEESSDLTSAKEKFQSTEEYIIRLLLLSMNGVSQYQEGVIREAVKLYPFKETMTFRQLLTSLSEKPTVSGTPGYLIVDSVVNGQKGFYDDMYCATCGEMSKTHKKCVKCKAVQYCSKQCQKLHWFVHKKECEILRKTGRTTEKELADGVNQMQVKEN
ncbi:hypothetical protein QYM36_011618 [Artemia franciscana]|uniref:MYND-type domain-containing protein n=2 Tax=Artemia franciscana TaxID=6661 RepID=A0AA88L9C5_ARTSF|nr:hypothetical protein QYM36_011618 [Artemia franciscana]